MTMLDTLASQLQQVQQSQDEGETNLKRYAMSEQLEMSMGLCHRVADVMHVQQGA